MHSSTLPYRAVAMDLDGTLLNVSGQISDFTLKVLRALSAKEVKLIIASGRMTVRILPYAEAIGLPLTVIAYNGAETLEGQGKTWTSKEIRPISDKARDLVFELCRTRRRFLNVYADGKLYGYHPDAHFEPSSVYKSQTGASYSGFQHQLELLPQTNITKLLVVDTAENRNKLYKEWYPLLSPSCALVKSNPEYLEFVDIGINKGAALESWLKSSAISKEELVALGDAENDLEMLNLAGMGIGMANATPGLRSQFHRLSKWSHEENGVAQELKKLFNLGAT